MKPISPRLSALCALALMTALLLGGCHARPADTEVRVLVDGEVWTESAMPPSGGLRVYIQLDGRTIADLPFDEPHRVTILQPDGGENEVELTGEAVRMVRANCKNQDCVLMGDVTRDNLELRAMGGFIVCLPHRLTVEVREE